MKVTESLGDNISLKSEDMYKMAKILLITFSNVFSLKGNFGILTEFYRGLFLGV